MTKAQRDIARAVLLVAITVLLTLLRPEQMPQFPPVPDPKEQSGAEADSAYHVVKVVDGDTIKVRRGLTTDTIRLIGIDTPETVHPTKPVQCFGREASAYTKQILEGREVRLETDASQGTLDQYGRTLAYVFLEDGTNVGLKLIEDGYAYEYTYDLPYTYQEEFKAAQRRARSEKRGLWADGVCS